jgi:hypothetical protein
MEHSINIDNVSDTTENTINEWDTETENLLKDIEFNCSIMSQIHKEQYLSLINQIKYYKIPVLILSSMNSIFAVGLSAYMQQDVVSTINCLISFICGVISSVELYLGLTKKIESQVISYRSFYLLSIKINNNLKLKKDVRKQKGSEFLADIENEYVGLFKDSEINEHTFKDKLLQIQPNKKTKNILLSYINSP